MVQGLDEILHGGLFSGGVYIFEGPPGVGKTTLANQIAYTFNSNGFTTCFRVRSSRAMSTLLMPFSRTFGEMNM